MSIMQGIESDVRFNHAAATTLASRCRTAADTIEGQAGSRSSWVSHGLEDFRGHYSDLFRGNGQVQAADARLLVSRLREVASGVEQLAREARSEQSRRETARDWKRRQDERGFWDHVADWFTGGEEPPVGPAAQPVTLSFAQADQGVREPLQGSGNTGTSSARPANLRSFATNSAGANDSLATHPGLLRDAYDTFTAGCGFGQLNADGVWSGFDRYLTANGEDVRWANAVASAFEAAGGDGVVTTSNAAIAASLAAAGVSAERQQLSIDPPQALGAPPTTGYANDPVNTATGNFLEPEVDLGFTGGNATLRFGRMYNSMNPAVGAFGPGWSSWADAGLRFEDDKAVWRLEDGREIHFPRQGAGWARATSEAFWLTADGDGFALTDNAGGRWGFGADGRPALQRRGPGTEVRFEWEAGRLVRLAHERGRSVTVLWAGERIAALEASDGRRVAFGYDDAGRLVTVAGPGGTRRYDWNTAGLVERVTDADGVVEALNTYDDLARVVRQVSRHGRVTRFSYLPGRVTVVDDVDGGRSNTWLHDPKGRLVGIVDADDRRQSMAYDAHGNLVMATGRDDTVTLSEFDERGRVTTRVHPSGERVETLYDAADRPTHVTVAVDGVVGTTAYAYDGDGRNPTTMTDPEGGVTTFTWHGNLLAAVVDPVGVRVTYTHDGHGDLIATTDALGNRASLERDPAGRVVAAVTPSGQRTTYRYDERGMLAERTDPDGGAWRFEFTAGGRLRSTTDPYGARTEVTHDEAGEASRTTDPLGRATVRVFDDLGNLARVDLPDGTAWEYTHDALSRLTRLVDPDGNAGTVQHHAIELPTVAVRHDRCGRPVEYRDARGTTTRVERDAAGRVVAVHGPDGATSYAWDACGRLASRTDAAGRVTTFTYTADGLAASETNGAGETTTYSYDACGRATGRVAPGLGRTTWAYDLAGRLVSVRDRMWGHRRFRYDAAGQLVEAVNARGGVTRYAHDALGRVTSVTDPLGHTSTRSYDHVGNLVASTDPLGRTTRAGYDAAGRQVWQEQPTGERLAWEYDAQGHISSISGDGRPLATFTRGPGGRELQVLDQVVPGESLRLDLRWDADGRLVERSRDGRGVRWSHDGSGRCTMLETPSGQVTRYERDAAGQVVAVDVAGLARVTFQRDGAGRLVGVDDGRYIQTWAYADGVVTHHTVTGGGGAVVTRVDHDAEGRVRRVTTDGSAVEYTHDEAGQLVAVDGPTGSVRWAFDANGRPTHQIVDGRTTTFEHDAAGQLVRVEDPDGVTTYTYDALGRRLTEDGPRGGVAFRWNALGWLSAVTTPQGERSLRTDALGELARVDDADVFWDSADVVPRVVQVGSTDVHVLPGLVGDPAGWQPAGWRQRLPGVTPWEPPSGTAVGGVSVLATGSVGVAGIELLGVRGYDPATLSFLSVDPLAPIAGTPWAHNPYSYAGNDPLHALDPTGRRPVTDAELQAYRDANQGFLAAAGDWVADNWEYLAGGAMVIAGGVLIATGVGGPAGMMLISAGADTIIQKATTGEVNWGQVAFSGVMGAAGGIGGAAIAGRAGLSGLRATVTIGAASGGIEGFGMGGYRYMTGPGPHTLTGFLTQAGTEGLMGFGLGAGGAAAGHGIQSVAGSVLGRNLSPDATVLSGHGGIPTGPHGSTFVVPEGVQIRMYGDAGDSILDSLGNQIERQYRWPFQGLRATPVETFGPGDVVPEHVLFPPNGLNIVGPQTTVNAPTGLSQLVQPHGGTYDWAACRNYF